MSYHGAIANFIAAMEAEGVAPVEPIAQRLASGELIRFRSEGDGKGRRNAWAILYLDDSPNGAFGNYRLGLSRKWRSRNHRALTDAERAAMQREWQQAKQRRAAERAECEIEAARDAAEMWSRAKPASADHGYVVKKGLDPAPFRQDGGNLLVPMYDHSGRLANLQRIAHDGTKRFLRGGRTEGLFLLLGSLSRCAETVCIGEGVATMQAIHRSSGRPCIAAFSAKNLATVARIWWSARPDLNFIICGDDDAHLDRNIGREAAIAAAEEIGARVTFPQREAA